MRLPGAETVTWPEALWSLIGLAGFLLNAWALWDAYGDRAALLRSKRNGARLIVASGNVRREVFRVFAQACFLLVGAFALTQPPVDPARPTTATGVLLALALIAAEVSMVVAAAFDRAERMRLLERLGRESAAARRAGVAG